MTVRAKMICISKVTDPLGNTLVLLEATRPEANDTAENRVFAEATPNASLSMQISRGKPAADQIEQGGVYYVDLIPADAVQPQELAADAGKTKA